MDAPSDEKQMRLRYAGACRLCGRGLAARTEAIYERSTKTVRCLTCPTPDAATATDEEVTINPGVPGGSARREYERRQAKRVERIRAKHPRLGGLILALSDDPQSTKAWDAGALGEERLGARLTELSSENLRVLHDRRIPGTKANIDHLAVTPSGVYVIDAKRYRGRPHLKVEGGLFRPRTEKLMVGTRDRSKLVDGVIKQTDLVRRIVADEVAVSGVLCFIEADWPLFGGAFTIRGVDVLWPKRLYRRLATEGEYGGAVASVHQALGAALPPA